MNEPNGPMVDLIIPARNEELNIDALLTALPQAMLRHVIVADNGSTDKTAKLAQDNGATVVYEPHRGYGAACLAGLGWIATLNDPPDAVAFIDADLADDPALLAKICTPITNDTADLVIGSRLRLAQPGALTSSQQFGNALACRLIRLCTGQRYSDLGPMRAVRWRSLQTLAMADRTWGWTVEMQFKAATQGLRIVEIDVPYRRRNAGQSKISGSWVGSVRAGWKIITTIAQLWWRNDN